MMIDLVFLQRASTRPAYHVSGQSCYVSCFLTPNVHNPPKSVTQRVNLDFRRINDNAQDHVRLSQLFSTQPKASKEFIHSLKIQDYDSIDSRPLFSPTLRPFGVAPTSPPRPPQYDVAAPREPVLARMTLARATARWHQFDHHQPQSSL